MTSIATLTTLPVPSFNEAEVWDSGAFIDTGIMGTISAVNDLGWAAGVQRDTHFNTTAFLWRNGTVTKLPGMVSADAINDSGQIAGTEIVSGSGANAITEAALYQNGQVTLLGFLNSSLANATSIVTAINNEGEVVGYSQFAATLGHAFLWKNGVMSDLGVMTQGNGSVAFAINNSGQIVGEEISSDNSHSTAVTWLNGKETALAQLGNDDYSLATGINDSGMIVGAGRATSAPVGSPTEAILWVNGTPVALNSLLPAHSGWDFTTADSVNDQGQIFGNASFDGNVVQYELTVGASGTAQISVAAQTAASVATAVAEGLGGGYSPFHVTDNATDVQASLDSLQVLAKAGDLTGVSFTDSALPTLAVTTAQLTSDAGALAKLSGNFLAAAPGGELAGFSGTASQYTVTLLDNGVKISGNGVNEVIGGVAELHFSDLAELVAQTPGAAGTVTSGNLAELYGAVFGRQPDIGGLAFYQNYLQQNPSTSLQTFAEFFLNSTEYTSAHSYAQTTAGETQFIQDSYQNLLHRAASSDDVNFYLTKVLDQPGSQLQNHAQMLVYLSASSEFLTDVQITAQTPASAQHWLILT